MKQLIYRSQPFGFDNAMLAGILIEARRNNARDDITGALICRRDVYLQLIEGPEDKIDALYSRILVDDRHANLHLALSSEVTTRMFPEWEMLDDEMPTVAWTREEIEAGVIEKATPEELRAVFQKLAEKARKLVEKARKSETASQ
jgi:hypothetical protein